MAAPKDKQTLVEQIRSSRKYRDVHPSTITSLIDEALREGSPKDADKRVRKRLHQIFAGHLGDPDYDAATRQLEEASGDPQARRELCRQFMEHHLTTRERLPFLQEFYREIFAVTGVPNAVVDLACGLNPLALPWMGLPAEASYFAYDIHERRVAFLQRFLALEGREGGAFARDVVFDPPEQPADVALVLKELHRLWKNYRGLDVEFLRRIPARFLVISFPIRSAHGGRGLVPHYQRSFAQFVEPAGWTPQELVFPDELVFCIDKGG